MGLSNMLIGLLSFISWTTQVLSLPSGAPSTACASMYPQHPGPNGPVSAQMGLLVPFKILVSPSQDGSRTYKIQVVRSENYPSQPPPLLGFFIQVRDPNADGPLGEFINLPNYARIGDCGSKNTVTHVDRLPKPVDNGLEFFWTPTNVPSGTKNLQVLGTFVQNMQIFWVKVPSQIFSLDTEELAPTAIVPTVLEESSPPSHPSSDVPPVADNNSGNVVNENGADMNNANNDRKPGFGNAAGTPAINNPPHDAARTGSVPPTGGAVTVCAGISTVVAALFFSL